MQKEDFNGEDFDEDEFVLASKDVQELESLIYKEVINMTKSRPNHFIKKL